MQTKLQLFAILSSTVLLGIVFELLRRRRLIERYALIWLISALVLLGLAVWMDLLETLSRAMGIAYPPNALFAIAFGFVLLLLLHFSIAISRLSGETKVLAQAVARLDQELRTVRGRVDDAPQEDALEAPVASRLAQPEPRRDPAASR
jgi:hypothetical protein